MPDIDTMKISNYLKKEDVGNGVLVTIKQIMESNIAKDNTPQDLKWLIYFNEFEKPLVSNVTHREQIAAYVNSRNTDNWAGKQVVLWNDPSVSFQGKSGAIRIRPAQNKQTRAQPDYEQNKYQPEFNDNIPGFD